MFGKVKENLETNKLISKYNIHRYTFGMFLEKKGIPKTQGTPELVEEFMNDNTWIEQVDITCIVELNETYLDVNNAAGTVFGGGYKNYTMTSRKKVSVKTNAYIAQKGIIFKKAINKAEDLRLPWEEITDCIVDGKTVDVVCDNVSFTAHFTNKTISEIFASYINEHKKGQVDDGWA
ncbi:MAG: hypothetical protein E7Z75_04875 [Methanobrevibacter olleyae]|uniref:Uncharacterized protein n=1 Tax=Methanobrevibacter olleyae TaxID=294671 RepID=A0A8T3VXQ5_METOL|nr:hypothetical protein [Methanobrevibacter olleyae]